MWAALCQQCARAHLGGAEPSKAALHILPHLRSARPVYSPVLQPTQDEARMHGQRLARSPRCECLSQAPGVRMPGCTRGDAHGQLQGSAKHMQHRKDADDTLRPCSSRGRAAIADCLFTPGSVQVL